MILVTDISFYKGKRVLVTGHTGFKGSWLCQLLLMAGADVVGFALEPPTAPSLFQLSGLSSCMESITGDVRDIEHLGKVFFEKKPEIVIHMAAQPLVRESYRNPVYTYETNVMGTVNVLECLRMCPSVRSFLNVTTDKVYCNKEWEWGYRENEALNGRDPYSNSKSCSELVTGCYKESFLKALDIAVSTARAGNVIGGGDFAVNRIIPDCVRAAKNREDILVRNPNSTRPYQHVLEPLAAYLMIAQKQYVDKKYAGSYNVGPNDSDCISTGELVDLFCSKWNQATGDAVRWIQQEEIGPHEANFLKLDCSRIKSVFGWAPQWNVETAVEKVVEWTKVYFAGENIIGSMESQVEAYFESMDDALVCQ